MGKGERSRTETQAHDLSSRQKENSSRSACEVGQVEGTAEEDFLGPDPDSIGLIEATRLAHEQSFL
jgi:hypothetical protein